MTRSCAQQIGAIVYEACCLDVRALKPGNVSVYSPGHRMTATDFVVSARVVADRIAGDGLAVGDRIRDCVEATVAAVGCNTNLGIVLLLAPLVHAMLDADDGPLRERLARVVAGLDVRDARQAYAAIAAAGPAGLGNAASQDVAQPPSVTLREAMVFAAERDRIAYQYANDFLDVFQTGDEALQVAIDAGWSLEGAVVQCYLAFLARFPDSHVLRKYGASTAEAVRAEAATVETRIKACDNLGSAVPILLKLDNKLKAGGINPGTSADLTIASVAAWRLKALL